MLRAKLETVAVLLLAICASFADSQIVLSAEIFTFADLGPSKEVEMKEFNGQLILAASIGTRSSSFGRNTLPFVSNGTTEGTIPLLEVDLDIFRYTYLVEEYKSLYYFVSLTTATGGLFATDGTPEGTTLVKDLPSIQQPSSSFLFQDKLYFALGSPFTSISKAKLWVTDGTEEGTMPILPEVENPVELTEVGGQLVFLADGNKVGGKDLFVYNVTEGTAILILPGSLSFGSYLHEYKQNLYFAAASDGGSVDQLWITDGTDLGTRIVTSVIQNPFAFATIQGRLVFAAADPDGKLRIYTTAGTNAVIVGILNDVNSFGGSFTEIDNLLYFTADQDGSGSEPWVTDGTADGTNLLRDLVPGGSSFAALFVKLNEIIYFITQPEGGMQQMWATDGSSQGTEMIQVQPDESLIESVTSFMAFNNNLFFMAGDGFWKIAVNATATRPPSMSAAPSSTTTPSVAPVTSINLDGECPVVPDGGCSICGENLCVNAPDVLFEFPGQPNVECGTLQDAGYNGLIPLAQCAFLPDLVTVCECAKGTDPSPTTLAPVTAVPATSAPVTSAPVIDLGGSCPIVPENGCSICGDNLCISTPDAIFEFPGQPDVTCGVLQDSGYNGLVPLAQCLFLPDLITVCECAGGALPSPTTLAPVTAVPATLAPVFSPEMPPVAMVPTTATPVTIGPVVTLATMAPATMAPMASPESPPIVAPVVTPEIETPPAFAQLIDDREREEAAIRANREREREKRRQDRNSNNRMAGGQTDIFDGGRSWRDIFD